MTNALRKLFTLPSRTFRLGRGACGTVPCRGRSTEPAASGGGATGAPQGVLRISAGVADGSLAVTAPGVNGTVADGNTLTSNSGSFVATGMAGEYNISTGAFCIESGAKAISNTSGGVQDGSCTGTAFTAA